MQLTAQQERAAILLSNAGCVCLLALGYEGSEFEVDSAIFYYRFAVPFVAFALVLVRIVSYTEHVLLNGGEVYWRDHGSANYNVGEVMKTYKTALIAGHGLVALTLALELFSGGRHTVLGTLSAEVLLQVAEAWTHSRDVRMEEASKMRPSSPESMV
jgi:hypothetical protein